MTAVHRRHGRRGDSGRVAAWIVLACTLLCGLLLALATAGPATASGIRSGVRHAPRRASTTPSPNCVGIDTYAVSEEELTACGDEVAPLTSVTADPIVGDVVTDYNYDVYGRTDTLTVPSSSFDPLTVSNLVLERLGVPDRPSETDSSAYNAWVSRYGSLSAASWATPPPYDVIATAAPSAGGTEYSPIWVGYFDSPGSNITESGAVWPEPTPHSSGCQDDAIFTWAGLSGINVITLEQAGTAYGVAGIGNHQGWSEFLPDQPSVIPRNIYATGG